MTARLQVATASEHPLLLGLLERGGLGAVKPVNKLLEELTDVWSFVVHELGAGR